MDGEAITPLATISVRTTNGPLNFTIAPGTPTFVLGGNGSGKSTLVHSLNNQLLNVVYLPGARPSFFEQEGNALTSESRRQLSENLRSWDSQPDNRWRSANGTSRNARAVHDLITAEMQFKLDAANQITLEGASSSAILRLQSGTSPLDRVNQLLRQANLTVRVEIVNGDLRARRGQEVFSYARMSDGERISLILCSEIITAPPESILLIDEPELHLHRSISVPLMNAVMSERRDCAFIVSTHELDLAQRHPEGRMLLIREYNWAPNDSGTWKVDVLEPGVELPEDLLIDILGSRDKLLFVEGTNTSLDQPLYALLFPSVSVLARSSCNDVIRAVSGLRSTKAVHHASAFGLVDNDGLSQSQQDQLESEGIFALSVHNVESLYYSKIVIAAVAAQQAQNFGVDQQALIDVAMTKSLGSVPTDQISHLAARLAEQKFRNGVLEAIPGRADLIAAGDAPISIAVTSNYLAERENLETLISQKALDVIVERYSVRHSKILEGIAKGLRFIDRSDYEKAALVRIASDLNLVNALKAKLGKLANALT